MELPDWVDVELWNEWIAYRREDKKKAASARSQLMTLRKLERLVAQGYDANRLLEHAIEHEWQGVYASDECRAGRTRSAARLSAVERVRAANAPLRVVGTHDGNVRHTLDEPARGDTDGYMVQGAG